MTTDSEIIQKQFDWTEPLEDEFELNVAEAKLLMEKAREETLKDVDNVLEEIDDIAYDGIHQTINEYDALEGIRDKIKDLKKSLSQKEGEKA
jgi:hypothetical protein